jgi:glycolate oxidase iron-sulfur subunit
MHLVDHARHHIEQTYRRPWIDRQMRLMLAKVLPYPRPFRAALRGSLWDKNRGYWSRPPA